MRSHTTRIRVRYGETDQMGVVYHANYLVYFEIGRTEYLRALGPSYAGLEDAGIRLAVVDARCRFRAGARYDDELDVETCVEGSSGARVTFRYEIRKPDGTPVADGTTTLGCIDESGRPRRLPRELAELLQG